jgi:phosphoglycolate phosphatase
MREGWTAWLILRARSKRVLGKNFRSLLGRPLAAWILGVLSEVPELDRVVINTDAADRLGELGVELGRRLVIRERPADLRGPDVDANTLLLRDLEEVPELLGERLLLTHATNPLLRPPTIRAAIAALEGSASHNSLFAVTRRRSRFFVGERPVNHDPARLLPTQQLQAVDEENSCLYLVSRDVVLRCGGRIGERALRWPVDAAEAIDIDEPADWRHAELVARGRLGSRPSAVLFDLDGTLIDSLPDVAKALSEVLAERSLGPYRAAEVKPWIGQGATTLVAGALRAGGQEGADLDRLTCRFIEAYQADPVERTRPFPGVEGLLTRLAARGVPLAVCTNKPWRTCEPVLERLGWDDRFGVVLTPEQVSRPKPWPDMLHLALERLRAAPSGAVFVGDGPADAEAAARAGIGFAGVTWGYAQPPLVAHSWVDSVGRLEEVLPILAAWGYLPRGMPDQPHRPSSPAAAAPETAETLSTAAP